ncbi:membrane dipeptidase, partial [Pseudomonas sp. 2822-17]|uniref:membrane dipeptidase n=1 Tax=Pseudomonas sp. 2822-17 TaxID=1712678 RepID=UPI0015AAEAAF
MNVIDLHCDALLKLWEDNSRSYMNHPSIEANFMRLQQGEIQLQLYAIFIEPYITSDMKFQVALEQIDLFHQEILGKHPNIKKIVNWSDIHELQDG